MILLSLHSHCFQPHHKGFNFPVLFLSHLLSSFDSSFDLWLTIGFLFPIYLILIKQYLQAFGNPKYTLDPPSL